MIKATNRYTPKVRERAVRMVLDGVGQHGGLSNRNASICMPGTPDQRPRQASANGSGSTTTNARIQPLAANHPPWSIRRETKQTTPLR